MSQIMVNMPVGLAYASNPTFRIPDHIELINSNLMDIATGKLKRLIISMPPRHGKSELTTKMFSAWYILNNPNKNVIVVGHGSSFAIDRFGRPVRSIVREFAPKFNTEIERDSNAANRFSMKQGGSFKAIGKGGDLIGRGADLLIIDDPIKDPSEAFSKRQRDKLWEWFQYTPMTRMEPDGSAIIIMTRWHNDDIVGRILNSENGAEWKYLSLPALSDSGEALWPQRYSVEQLAKIKSIVGTGVWNAQYQQRPITNENAIFKVDWWQKYNETPQFDYIIQSWDMAVEEKEVNDFYVCTTWGVLKRNDYLIDVYRKHIDFPKALQAVKDLAEIYKPNEILIEKKANGSPIIQTLKSETRLPIRPIEPHGSKETRAHAVTARIESGNVFIPEKAPWLNTFILETAEFPRSEHDDIVDSLTQALMRTTYYHYDESSTVQKPTSKTNNSVFQRIRTV